MAMWVRIHHFEPIDGRPWEWHARAHAFVESAYNGFRASVWPIGVDHAIANDAERVTFEEACEDAERMVQIHSPHPCGQRCLRWTQFAAPGSARPI